MVLVHVDHQRVDAVHLAVGRDVGDEVHAHPAGSALVEVPRRS
jgi:hypothetical protein